jgi:hypothetical protein
VSRVGAEIAGVQAATGLEIQRSLIQQAQDSRQLLGVMREILDAIRAGGTPDLIGEALSHSLQTFQAGA